MIKRGKKGVKLDLRLISFGKWGFACVGLPVSVHMTMTTG